MTNLYVDLSVLQTVPSSNINRDDTGAPKTALYGGVTRARVSSQSWKKAVRDVFKQDHVSAGKRTKQAANLLATELKNLDATLDDETVQAKVAEVFKLAGIKVDKKKDNETGALLLVSRGQIAKLAQYAIDNEELDKKEIKKVLKGDQSLDLALFGRMVADNPELNVDASAQVAHAISTHEVVPEYDYFTALDDEQPEDNAGAAMLGTIDFNSATLYRYANVNLNELAHNLNVTDAIKGTADFIKDFLLSMPTGKQNTFANKTLPSYVMVTIRQDTPVNLVSAFENPVVSHSGYVAPSVTRLEGEYQRTQAYVDEPVANFVLGKADSQIGTTVAKLSDLLDQVTAKLSEVMQDEDTND
ncbi:type I-E CRISPR-associated protein Cas7/Cse4/CasC [Levilactobacillus suantsaiihabitans]|uniref:Type I-E CRISPR-associated protein Cas7/Cse4/CasC n=1 Tax=Levilactobacillus suantsaiihabitans TaxID=2487722 RepID=A0A4Z0J5A8_9LACO|nr:type I-E CRISPR-associated protein Cas7/Cse4/CasC [Levilactobacillus suantsaiihabitans]TGD17583.1 type I-E CRISPR-associated protein Cas7/Cse4/CasC [Levilactobacillus suantsaiihabitans]